MWVDIATGHEKAVHDAVRAMPAVKLAHQVTGEHDLVVLIDSPAENDIGVVVQSIRKLPNVVDTITELVLS